MPTTPTTRPSATAAFFATLERDELARTLSQVEANINAELRNARPDVGLLRRLIRLRDEISELQGRSLSHTG